MTYFALMGLSLGSLLNPIVDLFSLAIVCFTIYFLRRQELSLYRDSKLVLLIEYCTLAVIFVCDLVASLYPTNLVLDIYTVAGSTAALVGPVLLSSFAYIVYVRPPEQRARDRLKALLGPRLVPHGILLLSYAAYVAFEITYLIVFWPVTTATLLNLAGAPVVTARFKPEFLTLLIPQLGFFLAYPITVLVLAARKSTDKAVKRSLRIFTVSWIVAAAALLIFNGYLLSVGYQASALGYMMIAVSLSGSVVVFRRATTLEEFFRPSIPAVLAIRPFSRRIRAEGYTTQRRVMLLEFDPATNFEQVVKDFGVEEISNGNSFFVFTSKGSPLRTALEDLEGARFFTMTPNVAYLKPTSKASEVLIPEYDEAVLLDVIDKMLASNPDSEMSFAFDSVSDCMQFLGFEKSYKLFKRLLELIEQPRMIALFLSVAGAYDQKERNSLLALFRGQLVFDSSGLRVTK